MNILFVNTYYDGGAANSCIRLYKSLNEKGINIKFLFLHKPNNELENTYSIETKISLIKRILNKVKEIKIRQYEYRINGNNSPEHEGFKTPKSIHSLQSHPLVQWADIIHLHWVCGLIDVKSFFKNNRKPIVWTLHDMWPFSGGIHYTYKFPNELHQQTLIKWKKILRSSTEKCNISIISPSEWLLNLSKKTDTLSKFPHYHIPYGIDHRIFKPLDKAFSRFCLNLPENKKIVLFVSHNIFNKRKGFEIAYKAISLLKEEMVFVLVGEGSEKLKNYKHVIFLGRVSNEYMMPILYSASDFTIIPSFEDNFPNVALESIACGTPLIGFNIGGINEIIIDKKNGLLCNKLNYQSLSKTIKNSLSINFDRNWIVDNSKKRFDANIQVQKYISLYKKIHSCNNYY